MKKAIIMIGIQGSGKSEFCRRYFADVERVNLDTLKTRNNEKKLIADCHARGIDYIVDNTNPTKTDRARYIPEAKAMGYRVIGYFMQSRLQECIIRNNLRKGKEVIPAKVIAMTSNRLEMPSMTEGFDELYFVANDGIDMTTSEWRENDEFR
jgi:predicted kinase